jgi:methyl-galactoside transport system permease protein
MAAGGALGAFNGFGVAKLKLHAFVVTLGSQLIVYGLILVYIKMGNNQGQPIGGLADRFNHFVLGGITIGNYRVPYLLFYAAAITGIIWFIWNKTKLGKNMYAVGGNPEAAAVSGVNLTSTIMMIFILSGLLYGAAGFLESARIGSNSASTGVNYELDAIAACVIGGVSFFGGIGTIKGIIIGVLMLQLINAGLIFLSVDPSWQTVVKGAIIILACAVDVRKYLVRK